MNRAEAIAHVARLFLKWGKIDRATRILKGLVAFEPSYAEGWYLYSRVCVRDEEGRVLQHVVSLDPSHNEALYRLVVIALERGDISSARSFTERIQLEALRSRANVAIRNRAK